MSAYAPMSQDLDSAIRTLTEFSPYPGHQDRKRWQQAIDAASDVQAQLALIEVHRPGILRQLSDTVYDEQLLLERPMIREVRELIQRYARTR